MSTVGGTRQDTKKNERTRSAHSLLSAEAEAIQDRKRKQKSEKHSLSVKWSADRWTKVSTARERG